MFVRPTIFSLLDREKEEGGNANSSENTPNSEQKELRDQPNLYAANQNDTKHVQSGPKAPTVSDKSTKSKPKDTANSGKKSTKKQETSPVDQNDFEEEIISLEGSPVIPGRRSFKSVSQESLDRIGGSSSQNTGRPSDGRGSPELPVFRDGSPDLWRGPIRSNSHSTQSGSPVKVLPTAKPTQPKRSNSQPPPVVKPKPSLPKKPQFLKQKSSQEDNKLSQEPSSLDSGGGGGSKAKTKKGSRFPKLPGFSGGADTSKLFGKSRKDSGEKKNKGGGKEGVGVSAGKKGKVGKKTKDDGRGSPKLFSGDHDEIEWEVPEDGRESPLLQGRRGNVHVHVHTTVLKMSVLGVLCCIAL